MLRPCRYYIKGYTSHIMRIREERERSPDHTAPGLGNDLTLETAPLLASESAWALRRV